MICISLYQINYNQDSKVYKYYKEIIADYNNIKNDNVAFTAEKLTKTYEQYKEEDSEYIEEAAGLIKEKEKYIESYNADNQSKNYNRILQSTLFGNDNSFYILNANKQIKDKENRPSVDVEMVNTTAVEKLVTNRTMPLLYIIIFTVIIIYFTEETDNGVLVLVRTSRRGRVLLPIVRCGIIIIYNIRRLFRCQFASIPSFCLHTAIDNPCTISIHLISIRRNCVRQHITISVKIIAF